MCLFMETCNISVQLTCQHQYRKSVQMDMKQKHRKQKQLFY
uniref:Uncharacterized protein n=1 Tax=Anguilla anguilla TaxID=7936 RepID=A0A0E9S7X9_ANGAN